MLPDGPMLILDLETTGLPGRVPDDVLCVVELGAAYLDRFGEVRRTFGDLVLPLPAAILASDVIQPALDVAGLTLDQLAEQGRDAQAVADDFAAWVKSLPGTPKVTAFNSAFDFGFMRQMPWSATLKGLYPGPCLMLEAMAVMGPHGALEPSPAWARRKNPDQKWRWPRASAAGGWLRERGHHIPDLRHHRAMDDAVMEAHIAHALRLEQRAAA